MATLKPQRSLVLREVVGLLEGAETLRQKVTASATKGITPMIDNPKALHRHITKIEDHLAQIKTLTQHRSIP